jgi:hypothetical protein
VNKSFSFERCSFTLLVANRTPCWGFVVNTSKLTSLHWSWRGSSQFYSLCVNAEEGKILLIDTKSTRFKPPPQLKVKYFSSTRGQQGSNSLIPQAYFSPTKRVVASFVSAPFTKPDVVKAWCDRPLHAQLLSKSSSKGNRLTHHLSLRFNHHNKVINTAQSCFMGIELPMKVDFSPGFNLTV